MDFNPYKTIGHDHGFHVVDDITFVDHSLFKLTAQSQLHSHYSILDTKAQVN